MIIRSNPKSKTKLWTISLAASYLSHFVDPDINSTLWTIKFGRRRIQITKETRGR